jgi:hypothetical protein
LEECIPQVHQLDAKEDTEATTTIKQAKDKKRVNTEEYEKIV